MPSAPVQTSAPFVLPQYAELRRMVGFPNKYCPCFPHPKQAYFLINPKLELLYGGAGYSGKSAALLMAALQYVQVPGYNALIFRRAYPDLARPEGIMSLAQKWLHGTDAKWNNETHTYTFPSGATLGFGYMASANDHYNYQGGSYQFCVGKGTPILLSNGSYRAIEHLHPGMVVQTLEGPRHIMACHPPRWRMAYKLRIRDVEIIVGEDHKILTTGGWVSPLEQRARPQESGVCGEDNQIGCVLSADGRQEEPQPLQWNVRAALYAPCLHQAQPESVAVYPLHGGAHAPVAKQAHGGFPSDYLLAYDSGDAPFLRGARGVQGSIQPQADVALWCQYGRRAGGQEHIRSHTLVEKWRYVHPYTKEPRHTVDGVYFADIEIVPVGVQALYDLTISGASHYISLGGIISQNCGFDEVTQFQLFQYNFMFGWLRRTKTMSEHVPLRMRSTTNPVGRGVAWVYNRFVKAPSSATHEFIPALYRDNPHTDHAAYAETLSRMDRTMRARIGEGQWNVQDSGGMFRPTDFKRCRLADVPQDTEKVRYWDLASTMPTASNPDPDWTVGLRMEHLDGRYFITDVQRDRLEPYETEQLMRRTAAQDGYDVEQHVEQEPGSSGKITLDHIIRVVLNGFSVTGHRETGDKVSRSRTFAAAVQNGNVYLVEDCWTDEFVDECVQFPDGDHDDQVDCASGAHRALSNVVHGGVV